MTANKITTLSIIIFNLFISGCKETVYTNLSEQNVNEMLAVLLNNNLDVKKRAIKSGKYQLNVETKELGLAISILNSHGYPKESYTSMGDLFPKDGLLSSPLEERARYIYGISQSIAETLSQIDGVIAARVNLVMPDNNPFEKSLKPSSASVFIKHHPKADLLSIRSEIKKIVENSIQGLEYKKVSLILVPIRYFNTDSQTFKNATNESTSRYLLLFSMFLLFLSVLTLFYKPLFRLFRQKSSKDINGALQYDK